MDLILDTPEDEQMVQKLQFVAWRNFFMNPFKCEF
jgi:hypothetical protein